MQTNTVQTLVDYIKDLTGQTNLSDAKAIRAINFAVDNYTYIALTSGGKWKWDSSNQTDVPRVTTTIGASDEKVSLETELLAIQQVEILENGKYKPLDPIDIRDRQDASLSTVYSGTGEPQYYDYDSGNLYIYPQSDTSRTLRVTYSRAHPRFTTSDLSSSIGVVPIHEEYIALYAADRVMIGTNDPSRTQIRNEMVAKEAEIRDMFSKRDQDTQRRLKASIPSTFMQRSRGKR